MIYASIVVYNSNKDELKRAIECTVNSIVEKLFVVDSSPTDKLRDFAISLSPKVEYIFGHGNIGYGSAHNIALQKSIAADAEYHIVVNPDVYFEKGSIENLAEYMDKNADAASVMPRVIYPDGKLQYLCKLLPTPADLIFRRFMHTKATQKKREIFELRFTGYNRQMNIPFVSGCFMFLRVSVLKKIGLFDQRFFMYGEDIDLSRRMHEHYKTMFLPDITIVHAHKAESYKSIKMLLIHIKNVSKYFCKWGWFFDKKRKDTNRKTLTELGFKNDSQ